MTPPTERSIIIARSLWRTERLETGGERLVFVEKRYSPRHDPTSPSSLASSLWRSLSAVRHVLAEHTETWK